MASSVPRDTLNVTLVEADFVEAYQPEPRARRLGILVLTLALALSVFVIVLLVRYPQARLAFTESPLIIGLTGTVLFAASLVIALLVLAPAIRRRAARSTLNEHPGMRDPIHYEFDLEQFAVRTTYSQANYPWPQIWDWRETPRVLIIMPTPRNFYVVPKRGMDPMVLERIRSYLVHVRRHQARI
jgi:hypothetical protein